MNLQQLEYIIAVDIHRHFAKAAKACHVTQPTLSMMIQKLEEELGTTLFDRSKHPVVPTDIGTEVIDQARNILMESKKLRELVDDKRGVVKGNLTIGILPTISPYLVSFFVPDILRDYPLVKLKIVELNLDQILADLQSGMIDVGIVVTPINAKRITTTPLFWDPLVMYASTSSPSPARAGKINPSDVWLLEDGSLFRSQVLSICSQHSLDEINLTYEAKSIETLIQLVQLKPSMTIIPQLATLGFSNQQQKMVIPFEGDVPTREISIATHRSHLKKKLIHILEETIKSNIPKAFVKKKNTIDV